MQKLMTISEVSEMINVKIATLYQWVHFKKIPYTKPTPRTLRFNRDEILEWLADRSYGVGGKKEETGDRRVEKKGSAMSAHYVDAVIARAKKEVLG
ncbi:MAG: helix-turn-helix transcriptional regulator [Nitrospirota bacterium]